MMPWRYVGKDKDKSTRPSVGAADCLRNAV